MELDDAGLDVLFRAARTPRKWSDRPVTESLLRRLYELVRLGPTSGNCCPARFVFLLSAQSREQLRPALATGNIDITLGAGATVIVAQDPLFYEHFPYLNPESEARDWFAADLALAEETAFRNASLQAGYLILAARALGLDVAPISGFDNQKVDELFLSESGWRSNVLINLGYADQAHELPPRAPRFEFGEICRTL